MERKKEASQVEVQLDAEPAVVPETRQPALEHEETEEEFRRQNNEERRVRRRAAKERIAKSSYWNQNIGAVKKAVFTLLPGTERPILVHKQQSYHGPDAISDELADKTCIDLGVDKLLHELNSVLGTAYSLDTPSLRDLLDPCIEKNYDFGRAYGYLRPRWLLNFAELSHYMESYESSDRVLREKALQGDQIVNPSLPPRRVWDLFSNRVLPFWVANSWVVERQLWAVSHSWMSPEKRQYAWTEINGRQWSVPIPDDIDLSQLRIELLNLGAEYVWLDVLCLRQNGRDEEEKRTLGEEWKLDVPTIGHVYHLSANQPIVCYYSGLGRPFGVEEGALRSERHWMNRAWTLQENREQSIVAGITDDSPPFPPEEDRDDTEVGRFAQQLASLPWEHPTNIFLALKAMQKRSSVNPVDKIAGLAYILQCNPLPVYKLDETAEEAWTRLVENLPDRHRGDLLFLYPSPGDGKLNWAPSWRQILEEELPKGSGVYVEQNVTHAYTTGYYYHRGYGIQGCLIRGLAEVSEAVSSRRVGHMVIEQTTLDSGPVSFEVVASHRVPIPDGRYTLVSGRGYLPYWVVAHNKTDPISDGELLVEKVSVLRVDSQAIETAIKETNSGQNILVSYY